VGVPPIPRVGQKTATPRPQTHVEGVAGVRRHRDARRRRESADGLVARLGIWLHVSLEAQLGDLQVA
jgi:hypothetical protein